MIKVAYILPPSGHFAGMERVVHDVASGLARQFHDRFDVTVLYSQRYPELPDELPYRVIWEDTKRLRTFASRMIGWVRQERYDVVIVAQFEAPALLWLRDRLSGGKARFVMHLHGNPRIEETGSSRARLAFAFFELLLPKMARVLAVSPSLARYVENRVKRPGLVEYVHNPVRQFSNVPPAGVRAGPTSFVTVGRLARQKGHDVLIDAMARLAADGVDARLTIVGEGVERPALTSQIARLGLQDRVRLAGSIPNPAAELQAGDCFVSASRWEGFGVAIVEGLSAGLYVIATDCEFGPSDVIDSPEKGRIVSTDDAAAFASAMADFARSPRPDAYDQLRRTAAAEFSLENVIGRHAAVIESVACGR